ncbi:carbohydrate-binding protein [Streptomyces sp. NPDC002669]|uniref:carbohydrate-binding protein n=1 Tax=Streptomyces sp. NPDC002669 TaxID=3364658 RepID=UPI00368A1456
MVVRLLVRAGFGGEPDLGAGDDAPRDQPLGIREPPVRRWRGGGRFGCRPCPRDTWADKQIRIPLNAGGNTITYSYGGGDTGNVNLDRLAIQEGPPSCETRYEAETAIPSSGAKTSADHLDYSGDGFADGYWNQGASATFTVPADHDGNRTATLRYANATGSPRTVTMTVNGEPSRISLPALSHWDTWGHRSVEVPLRAGVTTISCTRSGVTPETSTWTT